MENENIAKVIFNFDFFKYNFTLKKLI